jgi:imidazolonepropionase
MARLKPELVVVNGQIATPAKSEAVSGQDMNRLTVIAEGWVACASGIIIGVGTMAECADAVDVSPDTTVINAAGKVVLPGLVDSHTHLVFGGSREQEFYLRAQGVDYMDIMAAGGGILSSVRATRAASLDELVDSGLQRLGWMLSQGVTTVECKSGYGLDLETEIKQLRAVQILSQRHPIELVPTFLGAHAWPPEYRGREEEYVDAIIVEMLPEIARRGLAEYCDVFCEASVFSVDQTRRIMQRAQELGFKLRLHADEMTGLGGAELAGELRAASADHLLQVSDRGIDALRTGGVMPVLLPATAFVLKKRYAPARKMISAGLPVALATDFNPGSAPVPSMLLVMSLACLYMGLTPEEAH